MGNFVTQQETPLENLEEAEDDDCVIVGYKTSTSELSVPPPQAEEDEEKEEEGESKKSEEESEVEPELVKLKNLSSTAQASDPLWLHVGVGALLLVSGAFLLLRKKS